MRNLALFMLLASLVSGPLWAGSSPKKWHNPGLDASSGATPDVYRWPGGSGALQVWHTFTGSPTVTMEWKSQGSAPFESVNPGQCNFTLPGFCNFSLGNGDIQLTVTGGTGTAIVKAFIGGTHQASAGAQGAGGGSGGLASGVDFDQDGILNIQGLTNDRIAFNLDDDGSNELVFQMASPTLTIISTENADLRIQAQDRVTIKNGTLRLQGIAADPTCSALNTGEMYYNNVADEPRSCDGTSYVSMTGGGAGLVSLSEDIGGTDDTFYDADAIGLGGNKFILTDGTISEEIEVETGTGVDSGMTFKGSNVTIHNQAQGTEAELAISFDGPGDTGFSFFGNQVHWVNVAQDRFTCGNRDCRVIDVVMLLHKNIGPFSGTFAKEGGMYWDETPQGIFYFDVNESTPFLVQTVSYGEMVLDTSGTPEIVISEPGVYTGWTDALAFGTAGEVIATPGDTSGTTPSASFTVPFPGKWKFSISINLNSTDSGDTILGQLFVDDVIFGIPGQFEIPTNQSNGGRAFTSISGINLTADQVVDLRFTNTAGDGTTTLDLIFFNFLLELLERTGP